MSDTADTGVIDAAPADTAPVESAVSETTTDASLLDTELPAGLRQFDRSYVEKLRAEAALNRTKAREHEQQLRQTQEKLERYAAFDAYNDDDMQIWSGMATDWQADPAVAAQTMQQIAQRVLGDPTSTAAEKADAQAILDNPAVSEAAEQLTPEKVREIAREETLAQRAEREREEAVQGVFRQLEEAGYEQGTQEAFSVLWIANNKTSGDIGQAIEQYKAYEQSIVDRYVDTVAKGGTPVQLPAAGAAGSPTPETPKNIREAKRQADAWLAERYAAG